MNAGNEPPTPQRRLFLREPGWRIACKAGNEREFCYMIAPGQDYYHRLDSGELYVQHGDERLCLPCAERRGLLSHEIKPLREALVSIDLSPEDSSPFELKAEGEGNEK